MYLRCIDVMAESNLLRTFADILVLRTSIKLTSQPCLQDAASPV